jgi:hypothetical protein
MTLGLPRSVRVQQFLLPMSPLGHYRRLDVLARCPLYPRKRTWGLLLFMSTHPKTMEPLAGRLCALALAATTPQGLCSQGFISQLWGSVIHYLAAGRRAPTRTVLGQPLPARLSRIEPEAHAELASKRRRWPRTSQEKACANLGAWHHTPRSHWSSS